MLGIGPRRAERIAPAQKAEAHAVVVAQRPLFPPPHPGSGYQLGEGVNVNPKEVIRVYCRHLTHRAIPLSVQPLIETREKST